MKDAVKWIAWLLAAVVISVLVSALILHRDTSKTVGAITSPPTVLDFLQLTQGLGFGTLGTTPVTQAGQRFVLASPSQFPCVIANPYSSTSTISSFSISIATGSTTATALVMGTTTSAIATSTTPFITSTVAAGATPVYSFDGGLNNSAIGPGQFIVVGTNGGGALTTGVQYTGVCSATFQSAT